MFDDAKNTSVRGIKAKALRPAAAAEGEMRETETTGLSDPLLGFLPEFIASVAF